MTTALYVTNLLDRSRFDVLSGEKQWLTAKAESTDAELVIIDLQAANAMALLERLAAQAPESQRLFAYAGHVEEALLAVANALPGVKALPRSVFFRRLPNLS